MKNRNKRGGAKVNTGLQLTKVKPLTTNQKRVFDSDKNVVLNGCAGTGKTFIATALGLEAVITHNQFSNLTYIRSAVETRKLGFLPGTDKQKVEVYEGPYIDIVAELFDRGDAYDILKQKGTIRFLATSFLRGTTLRDSVVIIDECQNMTYHELDSVITRIGDNCQVYLCGDYYQSDLGANGLENLHKVLKEMKCFDFVEFGVNDIVRSGFVKDYIIAKHKVHGEKTIIE